MQYFEFSDETNESVIKFGKAALQECIEHLVETGDLIFDEEDTACFYWKTTGERLGSKNVND